jgi:hypothetical protein
MQASQNQATVPTNVRSLTGNWPRLCYVCLGSGLILSGIVIRGGAETGKPPAIHSIMIVQDPEASPVEQRIVEVLKT